jgi:general secretion pathway protein N
MHFSAGRTGMVKWPKILGFALLSGGMMLAGLSSRLLAAASATLDIISDESAAPAVVEIGRLKPIAGPNRQATQPLRSGNPLWAVPLSVLTATRERPIFSPSRRPQPDVVAPAAAQIRAPAPQKAGEPERPPLALVGAAVGGDDAIAVLLDRTNQKVVRLRQGESYAGWLLSAVLQREVTFKKADRTEVLVLGPSGGPAGAPGAPAAPGMVVVPAAGTGTSFAPFVPRSTPKNGEPDGL